MCGILEDFGCRAEASAYEHLTHPLILNQPLRVYTRVNGETFTHSLIHSALLPFPLHSFVQDLFVECLLVAMAEGYRLGAEQRTRSLHLRSLHT